MYRLTSKGVLHLLFDSFNGKPNVMTDGQNETNIHSFIVKIWVERNLGGEEPTWRGHITDVTTGERRYVKSLDEISYTFSQYINLITAGPRRRSKP